MTKRAGFMLLAAGIASLALTLARASGAGLYFAAPECLAIASGIFLLFGGPRAALWVRALAMFLLVGGTIGSVAAVFFQPLDLTITEMRLYPADFAVGAAELACLLLIPLLVVLELGRPSVRQAIENAGIRRWDMRIPAQAGAACVALAGFLLWVTLHGQTAVLAETLALQQLGPDYRYHLSWVSRAGSAHGTTITGIVTAWNRTAIRTVLLKWETR